MGLLRDRFGMQWQFVNTVEEEQNLMNFLILVDSAVSLRLTWESQKPSSANWIAIARPTGMSSAASRATASAVSLLPWRASAG